MPGFVFYNLIFYDCYYNINAIRMKSKLLMLLVIVAAFACFFYFMERKRKEDILLINRDFGYAKGIVVKKTTYKGRHIRIKYFVGENEYVESAGIEENNNIDVGDSILVKYSHKNPELIITQFSEAY